MKLQNVPLFLLALIAINTFSQQSLPKRIYTTKPTASNITIDGIIDDYAWNSVEWATDFIQKAPEEGVAPSYQTRFKITYDDKYLYVAIEALDGEPEKIQKRLTRRDGFAGDRVNVLIDSYHDKRTAFVFTITAAGVKGEEITTQNGGNWDASWNPIWYTKAASNDKGWTAEMKIPFSQLRFGDAEEQIWGLNIIRNIFRKNERSFWQRIPNNVSGFISEMGELHGLKGLTPQKQLEIQPFTVFQYDNYPKENGNPFRTGNDFTINGGLDAKIGVTNDLTLDLTINPDFGQVEADPGNIVLDGFDDVFFREQRPFFVENKNIFDFRTGGRDNLFYSRRIGRSPQGYVDLEDSEFEDRPTNTTILGAAKFSGKTKDGWSIGVLESVTNSEYTEIDTNGERREELVEPLTNYFVARAQKDFNERKSYIGGIFTSMIRDKSENLNHLHKAAYSGGIDFRHEWKNRDYYIQGNIGLSHVIGSKEAITRTQESIRHLFQRADMKNPKLDVNRTSLTGTGGRVFGGKRGGGNWRFFLGANWRSPEYEINDIGFLRSTNQIWQFSNVEYLWQEPTKTYRNISTRVIFRSAYDFEGHVNRLETQWNTFVNWANNWGTELRFGHNPRVISNTYLRGGPRWRNNSESFYNLSIGTDSSKRFDASIGFRNSFGGQSSFDNKNYSIRFNYQPLEALNLSLNIEYTDNVNKTQYVSSFEDASGNTQYILGKIKNNNFSTTLRLNYSINPNLSIQYYGQPFIARGRYSDLNYVTNSLASNLDNRITHYNDNQITTTSDNAYEIDHNFDGNTDITVDPNFSFVQFRSNLVVRWEYIPGSELFLVWSQSGTGSDDSRNSLFSSLNNQILEQSLSNTFLIKATYRFIK